MGQDSNAGDQGQAFCWLPWPGQQPTCSRSCAGAQRQGFGWSTGPLQGPERLQYPWPTAWTLYPPADCRPDPPAQGRACRDPPCLLGPCLHGIRTGGTCDLLSEACRGGAWDLLGPCAAAAAAAQYDCKADW